MVIQSLIDTLEQKVQQLQHAYSSKLEEKILAKFDRTLFSENGQTVSFYFSEIQQTLEKIKSLHSTDFNHYRFITEHLLKQCSVLSEALNRKNNRIIPPKPSESAKPKASHNVHKLPPRERLGKYYEALEQLNHLYQQQCDLIHVETNPEVQQKAMRLAEGYKLRRQKCQDAIDLLEEYLAFKEQQENKPNSEK
ncbi:primosomal replication protein PriC [Rodentibacter trehalosifermentans]|uniref:Primosomal replication protein N n=1 Tax=Rodentibacter trehalosifermentans TaxID=1908263 RepID=A0A1V3J3V0_9PAST|nr:primosomal replication protein PriC [Rodentibacter trehalosifermentans]OOF46492.1 primosomal replication protein N [Rodentibacter trehalosifermentans]OOF49854.1 primosomal replication protein N [Rodentibacter trehalosifermentans]OOF52695.1 primosomal replication protein N [Rodentibacter trehalosifermentans]